MMQEKLEKKNSPSSIVISGIGGDNKRAGSSAVVSVLESSNENDDKNSVKFIGKNQSYSGI